MGLEPGESGRSAGALTPTQRGLSLPISWKAVGNQANWAQKAQGAAPRSSPGTRSGGRQEWVSNQPTN